MSCTTPSWAYDDFDRQLKPEFESSNCITFNKPNHNMESVLKVAATVKTCQWAIIGVNGMNLGD